MGTYFFFLENGSFSKIGKDKLTEKIKSLIWVHIGSENKFEWIKEIINW